MYKKKTKGREPAKLEATKKLFIQITAATGGDARAPPVLIGEGGAPLVYARAGWAYVPLLPQCPRCRQEAIGSPLHYSTAASRYAGP